MYRMRRLKRLAVAGTVVAVWIAMSYAGWWAKYYGLGLASAGTSGTIAIAVYVTFEAIITILIVIGAALWVWGR